MAFTNSSARLASSPVDVRNPDAGGCASLGDVVWAMVERPGIVIPNPNTNPNRNRIRRPFMMDLTLRRVIAVRCLKRYRFSPLQEIMFYQPIASFIKL